ncbi:DUF6466 family protein [Bifidobacterium sp. ESL0800]|uniref:DUF6466 family protein n=1 Tax=Bifidobacterium sp. ESL0800 TaxID=2983236 RepID=UPI0023F72F7A|nr:DUF6466 family protein [Bifidobacterium sp. ESL0800]WEV76292.1 DUF6466 family protein [Bifidobacterium sp. ESL0800]
MKKHKTLSPLPPAAPAKTPKARKKQGKATLSAPLKANSKNRAAMASLPVRIIMGILAVMFLAIAGVLLANMAAIDTYNQATASLNASLEYAKKPNADPQRLKAQLDQANAQFDSARRLGRMLAPNTKNLISVNSDISGKLTATVKHKIASTNGNGKSGGRAAQGKGSSSDSAKAGNQGLTDEQKKQVEETLKANQPNGPVNGDKKTPTKSEEGADVKPW